MFIKPNHKLYIWADVILSLMALMAGAMVGRTISHWTTISHRALLVHATVFVVAVGISVLCVRYRQQYRDWLLHGDEHKHP